jgi:hypothetical protein
MASGDGTREQTMFLTLLSRSADLFRVNQLCVSTARRTFEVPSGRPGIIADVAAEKCIGSQLGRFA